MLLREVAAAVGGAHARNATRNLAIARNAEAAALLWSELERALGVAWRGSSDARAPLASAAARVALCAALSACVGGGCLLRSANGTLREPERMQRPYDPHLALPLRLERFDDEPWHLWDLGQPAVLVPALRALCDSPHHARLREALPLVMPSLGLLHKLGIRFRVRLHCACSLLEKAPHVFREGVTAARAYGDVIRVCRPEWAS